MQDITLFEYQEVGFQSLGWQHDNPALELLDRLNAEYGTELIQIGRKSLKARQFVGVLRAGELVLQVLPKIDYAGQSNAGLGTADHKEAADSAVQNFMFMLSYAYDLNIYAQARADLHTTHSTQWFELLTRLFALDLHAQIKRGMDQSYVRIEERSDSLRGTWLIDKHVLSLPYERHRFAVRYDEFLEDTPLNRVFLFVVKKLLVMTRDHMNRRLLSDIEGWLQRVSHVSNVTAQLLDGVQFSRLNERFQTTYNLARLFVENLSLQLISGHRQLFAFMFDMNVLFERFVARFLTRHRAQIMPPLYQDASIVLQSAGQTIHLAERLPDRQGAFRLRPDILIAASNLSINTAPLLIIDTKYKRLDGEHMRFGIGEGDFYQMLAYATRLNSRRVLLLYPETAESAMLNGEFVVPQQQETRYFVSTLNLRQRLENAEPLITTFRELFTHIL